MRLCSLAIFSFLCVLVRVTDTRFGSCTKRSQIIFTTNIIVFEIVRDRNRAERAR